MHGKLVIQVGSSESMQIDLSGTDGYVLGRSDRRSTFVPDIDLAEHRGLEKGVSRRHAAFVRYQDQLHVIDLGSVNGTFLNGKRLKPEIPHPISTGDQLNLGDLVLSLSLVNV